MTSKALQTTKVVAIAGLLALAWTACKPRATQLSSGHDFQGTQKLKEFLLGRYANFRGVEQLFFSIRT